ncbi:hypothetical protein DL95DRAFT_414476 [Leptodontidium sp. 2 PMI_412]|nr:hypothetical protein DL95DRAFT_414476 [Leptodontidium sp. 2 PMI_412]
MLLKINRCPYTGDNETALRTFSIIAKPLVNPATNSSIEAAALEINQLSLLYPRLTWEQLVRGGRRSFTYCFWKEVFFIETLVKFVTALQGVPDDVDGKWRDLVNLGWEARSAANDVENGTPEALSLYSFVARPTRDSVSNFSLWAVWYFRDILEVESRTAAPAWRAKEAQKAAPIDARIPVVAM